MEFTQKQLNRRSERALDINKPISKENIEKLRDVVNAGATSINGQGASAIFIQDKDMIAKLSKYNWNQEHIKKASLFILFVGDMNRLKYAYEKQGIKDWELNDKNFSELLNIGTIDATIKAQSVVDAALTLDMGTCFIGGMRPVSDKLIEDLNLPSNVFPIIGLTVGHIEKQEEVKPKLDAVFFEKYDDEKMRKEVDRYDEVMKGYYDKRSSNKKEANWSSVTTGTYNYSFSGPMYDKYYKLLKSKFNTKK
ncbi:nitroreductase family protein [Mycoplasma todarodis]|uniref:nitroreductase family protein n=1 Tax=Mycoplasma todarodis TaxID=1937191 RepID=UPI003B2EF81B